MPFVVKPGRNPIVAAAFAAIDKSPSKPEAKPEVAHPKESVEQSEPYRRLVAARACEHCGIQGHSQAAHVPPSGKGIKADDRETFALCCNRTGPRGRQIEGCHAKFDQWRLLPKKKGVEPRDAHVKQGKRWAAKTRREIKAEGSWPNSLPQWKERKRA